MTVSSSPSKQAWVIEQLSKLRQRRPELVDAALDQLLTTDPDLRWAVVVGAYMDQKINLGKAAELLGMHELELRERFLELGIPVRLGPSDISEAKAEVEAVRLWRQEKDI